MNNDSCAITWKLVFWLLFIAWATGAALAMHHVHGGFFTNYLADLTFPPWYYIVIRGPATTGKKVPFLLRWFGVSAGRAALSIFMAGVAYEIGQRYRIIPGTFDLWDIAAYGAGLLVCYACEKWQRRGSSQPA